MKTTPNGDLPEGWKWTRLGEFLKHRRPFIVIEDDKDYELVTVKLHGKGIVPRSRLKGSQIKTKEQQVITRNQLLVAEIDAKFGAFGIVPENLEGAIVSSHYFLYDIDTDVVLPQFLKCFISSGILTHKIQKYIQGALNYSAIRPHHILEVMIPVPRKRTSEQETIASRLAAIRNIQANAERQLEAAVSLERALMRRFFDFEEPQIS